MPEWSELVKRRLGRLGLHPHREEEISSELADHLQDLYEGCLRQGASPREAFERACEHVPDWTQLRRDIRLAEDDMNQRKSKIWLPGLTTFALMFALLLLIGQVNIHLTRVIRPDFWRLYLPLLFLFPAMGALGAYLSRQAGGRVRERILAALFPAAAMTALVFGIFLVGLLIGSSIPVTRKIVGTFLLNWDLIGGLALLLGALPLLKGKPRGPNPASETAL